MPLFTYYLFICLSIISHLLIISNLFTIYPLFIISLSSVYLSIAYQSVYLTVYPPSNHLFICFSISNVFV